jgi:hypothetical protein
MQLEGYLFGVDFDSKITHYKPKSSVLDVIWDESATNL